MLPMSSSIRKLGIDQLGVEERLALIGEIWDSVAKDPATVPVPAAHREEINQRIEAFKADSHRGRPADESIADLKRRL